MCFNRKAKDLIQIFGRTALELFPFPDGADIALFPTESSDLLQT